MCTYIIMRNVTKGKVEPDPINKVKAFSLPFLCDISFQSECIRDVKGRRAVRTSRRKDDLEKILIIWTAVFLLFRKKTDPFVRKNVFLCLPFVSANIVVKAGKDEIGSASRLM